MSGSASKWVVALSLTALTWIGVGFALRELYDFVVFMIDSTPSSALGLAYGYLIYHSAVAAGIVVTAGLMTLEVWRQE